VKTNKAADTPRTCPTKPGAYWFTCMENDYKPEAVEIIDRNGQLMADCPLLGIVGLLDYHNGLTEPRWIEDAALAKAAGTDDNHDQT